MIIPAGFFPSGEESSGEFDSDFNPEEFDLPPELNDPEELPPIRPLCEEFFAPGGPLRQAASRGGRPYEFRPQQIEMSGAIADALAEGSNLCIEAPTGVGKSFAYLIPLIYRSRSSGRPAIISTETINLQEQLIDKDIPLLRELTGIDFRAALAKGRHNYLCRRRLSLLSGEQRDALLPAPSLALDLDRIVKWLERGSDGDRDSIDFRMEAATWNLVCCETGNCLAKKCPFFRSCCYFKARQEWETADIVVANHALFFTDLAMRCAGGNAGALLPNYGTVLIDEAHTLENNAAEHLGLHLSRAGVIATLNRLYNPDSARGLLMRQGCPPELRGVVSETRDEAYGFFTPYENFLAERGESAREVTDPARFPNRLSGKLLQLCRALETEIDEEEDASFRAELEAQFSRCREFIDAIDSFTSRSIPESVYYAETDRRSVVLHAAPLNVAEILGEVLFNQDFPVVLCSATLSVRRSFDYFRNTTKDQLMTIPLPASTGSEDIVVNFGENQNVGYDFSVAGQVIRNKNWAWTSVINGSHVKDRIKQISDKLKNTAYQLEEDNPLKLRFREGGSQYDIYAVRSAGIDPATGQEIFINKNGEYTFKYDAEDEVVVGNTQPKLQGTWLNTLRYKGWSLNFVFSYTFGGDTYNKTLWEKVEDIDPRYNVDERAFTDRWKNPGDLSRYLAIKERRSTTPHNSERFVERLNELWLSSATLTYEFQPKFLKRLGFKRLAVGVGVSDIVRFSTVKYERGTSYPYCRTINLTFRPTF